MDEIELQVSGDAKGNQEKKKEKFVDTIEDGKIRIQVNQTEGFAKTSYSNAQNVHLNNSIRFADTKAGALVAVNGLIGKFVIDAISDQANIYSKIGLAAGLLLIIIGIGLSVWVVYPRKANRKAKGIVYWENIVAMEQDEYIDAVEGMKAKEIRRQGLINNYIQSDILTKKFKFLGYAFISSLIGYGILVVIGLIGFILSLIQ